MEKEKQSIIFNMTLWYHLFFFLTKTFQQAEEDSLGFLPPSFPPHLLSLPLSSTDVTLSNSGYLINENRNKTIKVGNR